MMKRANLHPAPPRPELDELMRKARDHVMTPEEVFEQRVSFAYGNLAMSNPDVTREMVRERALAELPDRSELTREDVNTTLARELFGIPPDVAVTDEQRRAAKAINFGILHGNRPQTRKGANDEIRPMFGTEILFGFNKDGDANEDDWMEEFGW